MNTTSNLRHHWQLEEDMIFLNHGSFGACPTKVLQHQHQLRLRLERQPLDFFLRQYADLLEEARHHLANFLHADPEGLAFVTNTTQGIGAVLRSVSLSPGDEVLYLNHAYGACTNALLHEATRQGAHPIQVDIPLPLTDPQQIHDRIAQAITPNTKLAMLDHITSATALVLPLEKLVQDLESRGISVLVDGAHAPGQIPLNLKQLQASWYVGNCHKWLCAPKGSAFLYARHDKRDVTRPLTVSHGATMPTTTQPRFRHEFDWTGTHDPTAWLSVPTAIDTLAAMLPGGWPAIMAHNHTQTVAARDLLLQSLGTTPLCPPDMLGSMATIEIPTAPYTPPSSVLGTEPLQDTLWNKHRIEVPILRWPDSTRRHLRISTHLHNDLIQIQKLAQTIKSHFKSIT